MQSWFRPSSIERWIESWRKDDGVERLLVIDTHTAGNPTRIVVGGIELPPTTTDVPGVRAWLRAERDEIRRRLLYEPRGGGLTCAVVPLPPTAADHDIGAVILEPGSYPPMCGHCMIGLSVVIDEFDLIPIERLESTSTFTIRTPAGLVRSQVQRTENASVVTLTNVDSFVVDSWVQSLQGVEVQVDLTYGGDFYPAVNVESLGLELTRDEAREITHIASELSASIRDRHLTDRETGKLLDIYQVMFYRNLDAAVPTSRVAVVAPPGVIDRSPCGTGSSALLALRCERGEMEPDEILHTQSIIGSRFTVTSHSWYRDDIGRLVVSPRLSGTAHVNGFGVIVADPSDELANGFPPL